MSHLQGTLDGAHTLRGPHELFLKSSHTGAGSEKMILDGRSLDVAEAPVVIERVLVIDQWEIRIHGHAVLDHRAQGLVISRVGLAIVAAVWIYSFIRVYLCNLCPKNSRG